MSTLLGIDIGGTAVKIGVVDENGKVLLSETRSVSFDGYKTSIMTTVANLAGEVLEKSPVKIEGIGGWLKKHKKPKPVPAEKEG